MSIHADDCPSNLSRASYMRSAYRHTSKFTGSIGREVDESIYEQLCSARNFSTGDNEVSNNYQRILQQIIREVFSPEGRSNVKIREEVIGQVRDALQSIFPDLRLHSLEDPEGESTFYF